MTSTTDSPPLHPAARVRAVLVASLLLALATGVHAAEPQADEAGLFGPVETVGPRSAAMAPPDDITVRRREVTIDFGMLARSRELTRRPDDAPARLKLNLFDDTVLTAVIDQVKPTSSGYSLSGRVEGAEHSTVILVVNGEVVAGSVRTLAGTYRIGTVDKRVHAIRQVDESMLPPIHDPAAPDRVRGTSTE